MFPDMSHVAFLAAAKAAGLEPRATWFYCAQTKRCYRYYVVNQATHFTIHRRRSLQLALSERKRYLEEQPRKRKGQAA